MTTTSTTNRSPDQAASRPVRRLTAIAHPVPDNHSKGQRLSLLGGFIGYSVMFSAALTMAFVACSIAF